jgi:pimeloyl-ACP methyl ester carboxylesterase
MCKKMKQNKIILSLIVFLTSISLFGQQIDTLVDVGGYKLHFKIIKGNGTPILFEAGSGAYSSDWDTILPSIYKITGTTLITYDRAGFGKSELNIKDTTILNHGILNGLKDLETGLQKLGYDKNIISVCHSYGGFYSTLFAARNPNRVKYVVRLDASLVAPFTDENLKTYHSFDINKSKGLGIYFETINFKNTIMLMRKTEFPSNVPVIDIIAGIPYHNKTSSQIIEFEKAHVDFVNAYSNRQLIKADGSAHNIKYDNPSLVINAIVKAFVATVDEKQKSEILIRSLDNAIERANLTKDAEMNFYNSANNLNELGYSYMEKNEIKKAQEIFKLNTLLFPNDGNVYDSYGEALLNAKNISEAKKMYTKSLELNPDNKNAIDILKSLSNTK